jgi:putative ABC transport system permease protein
MALLVAGMGVANLLFVSVAERSREIGMRRALGASAWAIAWQFLVESLLLCCAGAAVGVGAAVLLTRAFFAVAFPDAIGPQNPIYHARVEQLATLQLPGAKPEVAWAAVLISAVVAVVTGLLAGLEPALTAAAIHPAEAIRVSPAQRHRARSVMTVVQLALGVAAVLLLVSFYEGRAQTELASLKEGAGANIVSLQFADDIPGYTLNNSLPAIYAGLSGLAKIAQKPEEFRQLLEELSLFSYLDPHMQYRTSVRTGARAVRVEGTELPVIIGTVPHAMEVDIDTARKADVVPKDAGPMMAEGQFFSDRDLDEARRVCVLPYSMAQTLFASEKPTGQTVVIGGRPFQVSGVLAPWVEKVGPAAEKHFPVLVPATTFVRDVHSYTDMMDMIYQSGWFEALLRVKDTAQAPAALKQLEAALLARIRLPKYVVVYPRGDIVSAVDVASRQRSAGLRAGAGGIAALLIAIVGLVNMLLVSVHESVREVGLRRALGALRSQIGWQFVREGMTLAGIGSVLGLALALATARWLGKLADVPIHTPAAWAALCAIGAIIVGCIASLGPALHAARVEPVEALRYE